MAHGRCRSDQIREDILRSTGEGWIDFRARWTAVKKMVTNTRTVHEATFGYRGLLDCRHVPTRPVPFLVDRVSSITMP